ncbi:MAG: hypothetical protein QM803_18980 [Rhodocyclaceae bacterium]
MIDALLRALDHQILNEPRPRHDGRAKQARAFGMHVRASSPVRIGRCQPQADVVVEHVRRSIDFQMQCTPQRHADSGAFGCFDQA